MKKLYYLLLFLSFSLQHFDTVAMVPVCLYERFMLADGETLLNFVQNNNLDSVISEINQGTNIEFTRQSTGETALSIAAFEGYHNIVHYLLIKANEKGIDLGLDEALIVAQENGDFPETTEILLNYGANLFVGAVSPWLIAAEEGRFESMKIMFDSIRNQEDKNKLLALCNGNNDTALLIVANEYNREIYDWLLSVGAIDTPNNQNVRPSDYFND